MNAAFDIIETGTRIEGVPFSPTRESIREFCDASLDYNPLHLDDDYMKNSFGKTTFGDQLPTNAAGYLLVEEPTTRTAVAGVFACGDVTDPPAPTA